MSDYTARDIFVMRPAQQTLKAWDPFWDCVDILFEFENSDVADGETELTQWRIFWVAGVSLLRTVGHVLAKVDAKTSPAHADAINSLWRALQADRDGAAIFWEFIEKERNNLLKTYSFGAKLARDDRGAYIKFDGGADAFELFRRAVYWWRAQLMQLEAKLPAAALNLG